MKVYDVNYKLHAKDNSNCLVLADFHGNFDEELANYIASLDEENIIIAGDLLNGSQWESSTKLRQVKRFLEIIRENHNVIMGLGNLDLWNLSDEGFRNYKNLESTNIYPLFNESITLDNSTYTNFLPDASCYSYPTQDYKKTVDKILETYDKRFKKPSDKTINHLVSHNPYHFSHEEVQRQISLNYDFIETGHFHDGWLPTEFINKNYDVCIDKGFSEVFNNRVINTPIDELTVTPRRNLARGVVFTCGNLFYILLPNNSVYLFENRYNKYHENSLAVLNNMTYNNKMPAIVITGAINTFLKLPFYYPYITHLELSNEYGNEASSNIRKLSK